MSLFGTVINKKTGMARRESGFAIQMENQFKESVLDVVFQFVKLSIFFFY